MQAKTQRVNKPFNRYSTGILFLTWSVIGAWFFALPYTMLHVGIIPSIGIIIWVGILVVIMHLLLAEVSLALPGNTSIVAMWNKLFPRWLSQINAGVSISNFVLGILIYVMLSGAFIQILAQSLWLHLHQARGTLLYTIIIAVITLKWFSTSTRIDKIIVTTLLVWFLLIGVYALGQWGNFVDISSDIMANGLQNTSPRMLYSICILSFLSVGAIPLLNHITHHRPERTASIITGSGMIVITAAILFSLAVISLSGTGTTDDVAHGLFTSHGRFLGWLASIIGLCAIISSHIPVMDHLMDILVSDGHTNRIRAWRALISLPILIYLYFNLSFLTLLGVVGGILSGISAMLVCLLNIRLHTTKQKLHIMRVLENDQIRSRVVFVTCGVGVLYHIVTTFGK